MKKTKKGIGIKPLFDRVVLEREEIRGDKTTASGIIIPNGEKEESIFGKVVAVGPGKRDDNGKFSPMNIKIGDIVMFKKYSPTEISVNDKKYLICEGDDIIAVKQKTIKKKK